MAVEVLRKLIGGVWKTVVEDAANSGGSLPANATWTADALTVNDANAVLVFLLTTLLGQQQFYVQADAFFTYLLTTYNDNGQPLLESDHLANAGDGEVRIGGVALTPGKSTFPVSLAAGEDVRFVSATDPTTVITVANQSGHLVITGADGGVTGFALDTVGQVQILGNNVYVPPSPLPEIPAIPSPQDVADALVALGLATQA